MAVLFRRLKVLYIAATLISSACLMLVYNHLFALPKAMKLSDIQNYNLEVLQDGISHSRSLQRPPEDDEDKRQNGEDDEVDGIEDTGGGGGVKKIILMSYMRSGTSLTADVFNQHRDVFYIYEPLWPYDFAFKKGKPMVYLDGRPPVTIDKEHPEKTDALKLETVRSVLNCEFRHIGSLIFNLFKAPFASSRTKRIQDFLECWRINETSSDMLRLCLPLLQKDCDSAKVTMVKVLRLGFKEAFTLMEDDPQVKVIHMLRDPRGVMNSREVSGVGRGYKETFEGFCAKVLQDVNDFVMMRKTYPDRVLTVRYEDLTSDPLKYVEELLRFADLDFTPHHRAYVWNITSSGEDLPNNKSTITRGDAQATAREWRHQISVESLREADKHCAGLYDEVGYLRFNPEYRVRDLSQPYYAPCSQTPVPVLCVE